MMNYAALLAMVLAFALPAFANDPPKTTTVLTNPTTKPKGTIEQNSFSLGASNTASTGKVGATGKSSVGGPNLQNPCKGPNPPHSCKQAKPRH
jgi:hypothetical protein